MPCHKCNCQNDEKTEIFYRGFRAGEAVAYGEAPLYWTTADNKHIPLPDLTDDHLVNIIKHIRV